MFRACRPARNLQVVMPIINAPFQHLLRVQPAAPLQGLPQEIVAPGHPLARAPRCNCFKNFFPFETSPGPRLTATSRRVQYYGADYVLREPRKTFRLTISTSF